MKKIFSFFLLFSIALPLWALGIKGIIVDSDDQNPLDFVNVAVFKPNSKVPVAGVSTDTNGAFLIPAIQNGKYILRLSYVGYKTIIRPIEVTGKEINLGTLKMEENTKTLGEVEIVGQGSQMRLEADKKVFSVDQNIAAAGGSASDVLKNIPSVTVDNQGNVSLRKDGNVEVWINGKASGLTADNRAQILQQMPAESIESIEIMTNPSAKFSPEGSAGIINIVMKQNHKAGYYGSVSAGITYPDGGKLGQNVGASINYTNNKIDAYMNLGYRAMSFQGGGVTDQKKWILGNDTTQLNQRSLMNTAFSGLFLRAGFDYHLDAKNTLSLSGFGMAGSGNQGSTTHDVTTNIMTNPATLLRDYSQINSGNGTRPSLNLNFDYKHEFDKKGTSLTATVSYSTHDRTNKGSYQQVDSVSNTKFSDITQTADSKNSDWEFKADYTNKLSENSKLEAGWDTKLSNRISSSTGIDNIKNAPIPSYFDTFNYDEQIHAGYLTYANRIDKLNFQLGLRAELQTKESTNTSKIGVTNRDTIQTIAPINFFHIFPSFYLSYSLPNDAELQFNYSNRVNRPRGQQINPFKNFSDSLNISYGNPDLRPQYSSSLELNYVKTWGAQTLSTSLYYHNTDDVIQSVRFLHNGTMESTFANVTKSQNAGLELISKNRLFKILSLTTSLNFYYSKLDASVYKNPYDSLISIRIPEQSNFSWSANILANFMLSKTFSGQITAEYESPEIIAQGYQNAKYSVDFGVRQTFLDRKLSVSLNVRDLLNSDRDHTTTSGTGFSQNSSSYFHGRMAMLTVSYNFGNMKPKPADMKKMQNTGGDMMDNGE